MTWTYTPVVTERDMVRFLVGDTNTNDQQIQDEEIAYHLLNYPKPTGKPPYLAAAAVADAIASEYARKMNRTLGPLSAQFEQQYLHYLQIADKMRLNFATDGEGIGTGSIGFGAVKKASPSLGGGGRTYLGGGPYQNVGEA